LRLQLDNGLTIQDFNKLLLYGHWKLGFRHSPPVYRFTGCKQASFGSGSDLFLVAAGTGTAAQNHYHIDIIFRQRYQLKTTPLFSHLRQMTGYPTQVHARIAGTAILQSYLSLATFL
jgi:hypothetical protein